MLNNLKQIIMNMKKKIAAALSWISSTVIAFGLLFAVWFLLAPDLGNIITEDIMFMVAGVVYLLTLMVVIVFEDEYVNPPDAISITSAGLCAAVLCIYNGFNACLALAGAYFASLIFGLILIKKGHKEFSVTMLCATGCGFVIYSFVYAISLWIG